MLTIKLNKIVKNISNKKKYYNDKFSKIILFLRDKNDKKYILINTVIIDLKKGKLLYLKAYSKKNINIVKRHHIINKLFGVIYKTPHTIIEVKENQSFYLFVENNSFFYYIDYKFGILKIFIKEDIMGINDRNNLLNFCSTPFKNTIDNSIYFSATILIKREYFICYYKASIDFNNIKEIYRYKTYNEDSPHSTIYYKGYLFNSFFYDVKYRLLKKNTIFNKLDLYKYIFSKLYKKFCKLNRENFNEDKFGKSIIFHKEGKSDFGLDSFPKIKNKKFLNFYKSLLKKIKVNNFLDFCNKTVFKFRAECGYIKIFDINKNKEFCYKTTFSSPAHFEIGENDYIYVSNHNIGFFDRFYFFGAATIDKYKIKHNTLIKKEVFIDKKGYRFASHKVFKYKNKEYICTIGHPNRLFIISTDNMKKYNYIDLYENYLDNQSDINFSLNNNIGLDIYKDVLLALETSNDGKYIYSFSKIRNINI